MSELSQTQKDKCCLSPLVCTFQSCPTHRHTKQNRNEERQDEEGNKQCVPNGHRVFVQDDEKCPETDGGDGCTLQMANFMWHILPQFEKSKTQ
jgi:hypothetical protein